MSNTTPPPSHGVGQSPAQNPVGHPPTAPKKKSKRRILIGGGVLLVGVIFGVVVARALQDEPAPIDQANAYLAALEIGDFDTAKDLAVDPETAEEIPCRAPEDISRQENRESRLDEFVTDRDLTGTEFGTFRETEIDSAEVTGTYRRLFGGVGDIGVTLVNTGNGWRVCEDHLNEALAI